jgi:hypothetical protein
MTHLVRFPFIFALTAVALMATGCGGGGGGYGGSAAPAAATGTLQIIDTRSSPSTAVPVRLDYGVGGPVDTSLPAGGMIMQSTVPGTYTVTFDVGNDGFGTGTDVTATGVNVEQGKTTTIEFDGTKATVSAPKIAG